MRLRGALVSVLRDHLAGSPSSVPEAGRLLWSIFADLSATRTYHMAGPNPISFAEIEAYCRLLRWPLEPHHVAIIRALDMAWLEHAQASRGGERKTVQRSSGQAVTPASFDAVFG